MSRLPDYAQKGFACLRETSTRIYLGARYGLTPQTFISPEQVHSFLGMDIGAIHYQPFCQIASRLESTEGRTKLTQTFADRYDELENLSPDAREELDLLQPTALGKVVVTGTYSSSLLNRFERVTTAINDDGVSNISPHPGSQNTYVVMLHGRATDAAGVLVAKEEVDGFKELRPALTELMRGLLKEQPWIVLGFDRAADETFARLCWKVCQELGHRQRPIYVVDPRESAVVVQEWLPDPLRHIRMHPLEFLRAFAESQLVRASAPSDPPTPASPKPAPPGDERADGEGLPLETAPRPRPADPTALPSTAWRSIEIVTMDNRAFRTRVPGDMRVSALAGQFVRRHVHGDGSSERRERAVIDVERGNDQWDRLNGNHTIDQAGVKDGDRARIYSDAVAGATDPRRREAYLNDVQRRLEGLADHDERVEVRPNLPRAADRYEITLHCGGWGPPESAAERPYRTHRQEILLEYPAEAPEVPPFVWWRSPVFHPNVHPKNGHVCLGALQESFTPLFGPVELVRMLVELSEYRNYELDGVLNREAAIWAQLRPDLVVEHGGWAYQPTLKKEQEDEGPVLEFEETDTAVGLRRRRKS